MRIRNIGLKKVYDVYAIAVHTQEDWVFRDRVIFYTAEEGQVGLSVEKLSEVEVIDNEIGKDFRFQFMRDGSGFMILSGHFTDTDHLARLVDLDHQTLIAFEAARAMHASRKKR
ncbi:MAG: hypothetical protein EOS23_18460 [Mesorhizobium sp.]|uniref:hypothetical protein n=1 Tax=unclassified Mesorhizobium TaxID=325217 RepID=UPI000FD4BFD7|nr:MULTISPECIES: hypothetical protein [unclassified Mesorhizobium]RUV29232.1 hypothetical protein EOA86_16435 [Mesorhizobium sp. M5C.F.Ca.IN.020.32.2.1]RWC42453.1 MAG: hypothetical protein EOS28_16870 [Mesorhizobium sp.]RWE09435.1 MAG: hypothetical protein EOS23_18460 [Mesorhizobium sp.]RWE95466.1 MAG: hypothetical protein EOS68_19455 [Mesorhizobium sp.]RWG46801.1 MAG: hypothetical protein EOQ62_13935 [Mesorhizobium sp.]